MTGIKVYSNQKPTFPQTVETYTVKDSIKSASVWYSEIKTRNYNAIKTLLEQTGYTAHPASNQEIGTKQYTIFQS